eukprot:545156-Alexandrium_andersonii.AAC.1
MSGIEWDAQCVQEILLLPHGPSCLFRNIGLFWRHELHGYVSEVRASHEVSGLNGTCLPGFVHTF